MRAQRLWGIIALYSFLIQWQDIVRYASDDGLFPLAMIQSYLRHDLRFSLLDFFGSSEATFALYLLLLLCLLLVTCRIATRWTMLSSMILMTSFHERAIFTGEGGDNVMRLVGFILLLASFDTALRPTGRGVWPYAPTNDSPIWPRLLLFAELIILYLASAWTKLLGETWRNGSAFFYALHNPHFQRFPDAVGGILDPLSLVLSWGTIAWELLWITPLLQFFLVQISWGTLRERAARLPVRPFLLLSGVIFHALIFLLFDVGTFSLALLPAYVGACSGEEWEHLKRRFGSR